MDNNIKKMVARIQEAHLACASLQCTTKQKLIEAMRPLAVWEPIQGSCTCHKCVEGWQECGDKIRFVAKWRDESRPLPTGVHSSYHDGLDWDGVEETDDPWWGYGQTEAEALQMLAFDTYYEVGNG